MKSLDLPKTLIKNNLVTWGFHAEYKKADGLILNIRMSQQVEIQKENKKMVETVRAQATG